MPAASPSLKGPLLQAGRTIRVITSPANEVQTNEPALRPPGKSCKELAGARDREVCLVNEVLPEIPAEFVSAPENARHWDCLQVNSLENFHSQRPFPACPELYFLPLSESECQWGHAHYHDCLMG